MKRDNKGRFPKGISGNPGGRPPNLMSKYILDQTNNGEEIAIKVLGLFRRSKNDAFTLECAKFLRDSSVGQPTKVIDLGDGTINLLILPSKERGKKGVV